jgi:predicted phosphodiesterase
MTFSFDLISDLHVDTWPDFNWIGQPTAPYCVVAGDVSKDRTLVRQTLEHLGEQYAGVFYIDGNEEHREYLDDLGASYKHLETSLLNLHNVVYLQNNVVIINGVAIIATNGWWTYDLDPLIDPEASQEWFEQYLNISSSAASNITGVAYHDASYLINTVSKLQTQIDVKSIVVVSHTLPAAWLIKHDIGLADSPRFNLMGNDHMQLALNEDTEGKIKTWCFGHYHLSVDRTLNGIRYVNNPRGRGNTPWSQPAYYPKRISILG